MLLLPALGDINHLDDFIAFQYPANIYCHTVFDEGKLLSGAYKQNCMCDHNLFIVRGILKWLKCNSIYFFLSNNNHCVLGPDNSRQTETITRRSMLQLPASPSNQLLWYYIYIYYFCIYKIVKLLVLAKYLCKYLLFLVWRNYLRYRCIFPFLKKVLHLNG